MSIYIRTKLDRLRGGSPARVLDLFSGCGGFMLGFQRAGCVSVAGVEVDGHAMNSYARNFHSTLGQTGSPAHNKALDITKLCPTEFSKSLGCDEPRDLADIIIGGPPCPAFTRVGRAKLREVYNHPEAHKHDPRWQLYLPYLDFVRAISPVAVVMENVPDILNFGGENVAEVICDQLEEMGYRCRYTLLNAANYGVPQMRERFFLVGIHECAEVNPSFPMPTRNVNFPSGYESSRAVALRVINDPSLFTRNRFHPTPNASPNLPGPVTVADAIGDLPPITSHLDGTMKRGARKFDTPIRYRKKENSSDYVKMMTEWPGFENDGQLTDHVTRCLKERDFRLFRNMQHGADYPAAHKLATRLFQEEYRRRSQNGNAPAIDSQPYKLLRSQYVPPYSESKFPNKWRKTSPDKPARTLMAHLGKDGYTHIHYDGKQARVISVREAARLQSFPDGFTFSGTMNPAFRQIGNAVPPLLALELAKTLLYNLKHAANSKLDETGPLEDAI